MDAINVIRGNYLRELLSKGSREDSRGFLDYRDIKIKKNVLGNAEGSAQADLGGTRVLAGVKMNVEAPMPDTPDQGNLVVSGELLPLASADYEMGPPSPQAIEFARVVDRGLRHGPVVKLEDLFIEEAKVWTVFIDLYVLNYDGNLFDTATLAAMAALSTTKMPKYEDGKVIRKERTKPLKIENMIASSTFAKINEFCLLDPDGLEEDSANTRLTIATDGSVVHAMQKGLSGSWTSKEVENLIDISLKKYDHLKSCIIE